MLELLFTVLLTLAPGRFDRIGLATCYSCPRGQETRSGVLYHQNLWGVAVDDSEWGRAKYVVLTDLATGQAWVLPVVDTGYLYRAGGHTYDGRYWQKGGQVPIVVDLPCGTHNQLLGVGDALVGISFLDGLSKSGERCFARP